MIRKFCLAVVLLLGLSACSNVAELSDDVLAEGGGNDLVLDNAASHFDLLDARAEQDAAVRRWRASGIDTYELRVTYDISGGPTQVLSVVDGLFVSEIIEPDEDGEVYGIFEGPDDPRSVEGLLALSEAYVRGAELAPPNDPSSCDGHYFWISYDKTGLPARLDTGSPCEDSVGVRIDLVETGG